MPLATRSRYRRTSLTCPVAMTIVPGSQTSASALISFSGSADSDRSTNRMFGLAETDSACTALRRPPLLTFSGDQPCSTAIGRSMSAVASSQTKAVNGSRKPARGCEGAFILVFLLRADVLQALRPGRFGAAVGLNRLGRSRRVDDAAAFATVDEILGIGDHCRQIGVHAATVVRHAPVGEIGLRLLAPIGATRDRSATAPAVTGTPSLSSSP